MNQVFYISNICVYIYVLIMKSNYIYDTIGLVNADLDTF